MSYRDQTSMRPASHPPASVWGIALAATLMLWGIWWGWPNSFDQHDPTARAIAMLWNRTLDPGIRYWGAFGYQEVLVLAVAPVTLLKKILGFDPDLAQALMYLATRVLWALKGIGIVWLSYLTSRELFLDRRGAIFALYVAALSPGLIAWAHIPQVDIAHAFWYAMAAALAAAGWRRSNFRLLWLAAIAAGLAAGVKYVGGIIVLAPMLAVWLRYPFRRAVGYASILLITALTVFFITTPLVTGEPLAWLPQYTADVLANKNRELHQPLALWTLPGTLWDLLGPGTSVLAILGVLVLVLTRRAGPERAAWAMFWACVIPYYLVFSAQHVATVRYMLPLTSMLAVGIGYCLSPAFDQGKLRGFSIPLISIAFVVQTVLAVGLAIGFSADTRYQLASWLEDHTRPGDQVETLLNHRPYFVSDTAFQETARPHFQAESHQMYAAMQNDRDSLIRRLHESFARWTRVDEQNLVSWVERERDWLEKSALEFDTSVTGPSVRGSKYVVMNLNTAHHYVLDWPGEDPLSPNERDFFLSLMEETGPFRRVARFESVVPEVLRYPRELWINVSPTLEVYEVVSTRASGGSRGVNESALAQGRRGGAVD